MLIEKERRRETVMIEKERCRETVMIEKELREKGWRESAPIESIIKQ